MADRADIDALLRVMPNDHGADERVDWAAAEARLGTSLPDDYRAFMAVYGGGAIDNLIILPPLPTDNSWSGSISEHTKQLRDLWDTEGGVPGVPPGANQVLSWGTGCNANELGWLVTGLDPNLWPVVVWRRHESPPWALFECGMAEFIRRLMTAEFDECPLSDLSLWGRVGSFVHHREQQRRFHAGLDPMTGEPDPYADMFG
ncbi:SMI1/KNR4 family protein [Kibdelosporangium persicum]|uniref:SMI1-KNR4 cell-wall n=1 Tax=Kibdelosporangium persicum TaxID=2698649 RepID=A0ABX2EV44_9PSEU|nr:SMI1/KNR4 family protein [Kibdelosporangium persicum]NRN62817.1 SMI1-KNR4 cell-wall [Kibdelosporangium persicum]